MVSFLEMRMKDLPLDGVDGRLQFYRRILQNELRRKGICFDFHLWVSDEWFCPDGVPGFALPYYLFNPSLLKLHKKHVGFVEGATDKQILKLMRHELGHALDNAFGLRKVRSRQELFGDSTSRYPRSYSPMKHSQSFVHYLGDNYAQSHPDEDFAETFAYWLDPDKEWKRRRLSTKVTQKLFWMEENLKGLSYQDLKLKNKYRIDPIDKNKMILKDYFKSYQRQRGGAHLKRLDQSLQSLFRLSTDGKQVSQLIRQQRKPLAQQFSLKAGVPRYEVDFVLTRLAQRAEDLGIRASLQDFRQKSPSLVERNFRYLKENNQIKYYL